MYSGGRDDMLTLLIVAAIAFATLQSLFSRLYSDHYPRRTGMASALAYAVFYGAFIGLATLALEGFSFEASSATWILGAANALALSLYNLSLLQAGVCGGYAAMMVSLLSGGILVPAVTNAVFLGQSLGAAQLAGIILLLMAIVLMNLRGLSLAGQSRRFYVWCALLFLANGLYGSLMSAQPQLAGSAQRGEMIAITYMGSALSSASLLLLRAPRDFLPAFRMGFRSALCALGGSASATIAANLALYLLHEMNPTIANTINNGGVLVLSTLLSAALLHEKLSRPAALGLVSACAGIVLMRL